MDPMGWSVPLTYPKIVAKSGLVPAVVPVRSRILQG